MRDEAARYGREQEELKSLKKRHEEVENEIAHWVKDAEQALRGKKDGREAALLDYRFSMGVDEKPDGWLAFR